MGYVIELETIIHKLLTVVEQQQKVYLLIVFYAAHRPVETRLPVTLQPYIVV